GNKPVGSGIGQEFLIQSAVTQYACQKGLWARAKITPDQVSSLGILTESAYRSVHEEVGIKRRVGCSIRKQPDHVGAFDIVDISEFTPNQSKSFTQGDYTEDGAVKSQGWSKAKIRRAIS